MRALATRRGRAFATSFGKTLSRVLCAARWPCDRRVGPEAVPWCSAGGVAGRLLERSLAESGVEESDQPREVVEVALAHVIQNKVEAAYARSDLFERRQRLMADWTAYFDGGRESAGR